MLGCTAGLSGCVECSNPGNYSTSRCLGVSPTSEVSFVETADIHTYVQALK